MIKDFKVGEQAIGYLAVKSVTEKKTKKDKTYLDIQLQDTSGEINAKVWDIVENIIGERPKAGDIVKVDANVDSYNQSIQLNINKIRIATEKDNYDLQSIIQSAPIDSESMYETIQQFISKIKDDSIRNVVSAIVAKYKSKLMYYPAAKSNHHSIQGGLLYHITTMLQAAEKLMSVYPLNTDYLYAGIILHDMGKVQELYTDSTASATEYTIEGELLGHIAIGMRIIEENAPSLDAEKKLILQHMILSHHQNPEWGSPVRPMTAEAEMLHHLDMIDSRMYDFQQATQKAIPGLMSEKVYSLNNRKVYRGLDG